MNKLPGYLCGILLLAGAATSAQEQRSMSIVEVIDVDLQAPARFWQDGRDVETQETTLIRVQVDSIDLFLPRGSEPPLFVVGDSVAETVQSPLGDGIAVILAPRSAVVSDPTLWMTLAGTTKEQVTSEWRNRQLENLRDRSPDSLLRLTPAPEAALDFQDLETIREQLREGGIERPET